MLDKSGRVLEDVKVKGYLRKQHYGENNSETKWIYIDDFDSSRWVKKKDKKIIVDMYDKS